MSMCLPEHPLQRCQLPSLCNMNNAERNCLIVPQSPHLMGGFDLCVTTKTGIWAKARGSGSRSWHSRSEQALITAPTALARSNMDEVALMVAGTTCTRRHDSLHGLQPSTSLHCTVRVISAETRDIGVATSNDKRIQPVSLDACHAHAMPLKDVQAPPSRFVKHIPLPTPSEEVGPARYPRITAFG